MEISDVRVKLILSAEDRLKAVCSVTFDETFVVRDLKVVDGVNGLFVAMPSRKLSSNCPRCKQKNHLKARYCNECGGQLPPNRGSDDPSVRNRLHRDLAHPISIEFREELQRRVLEAFEQEVERSKDPNYRPRDIDAEQAEPAPEATEPVEPRGGARRELSEYDAMIAGLKAGTLGPREQTHRPPAPPRGRDQSTSHARGPGQPTRDDGSRRPARERGGQAAQRDTGPRRNDQGTRRRGETPREGAQWRDGQRDQRSEHKPAPRVVEETGSRPSEPKAETAVAPAPPPAPPRRPAPPPAPVQPKPAPAKPAPTPDDDGLGFGAGLF